MKIYWAAGAALVGYLALAWLTGGMLHLDTTRFYLLFAILAVLGIGGTAVVVWFWNRARGDSSGGDGGAGSGNDGGDEIDALVREAEARLAQAHAKPGASLGALPLVFVIGEPGSTKTSTVLHSGLDPELLAGSVYQDNAVAPTRTANFWYAHGMVFVEAGGKLLAEPERWLRLVRRLRPAGLRSVMGGAQAPRAALLCVDIETFARQGAADALAAQARTLHARLGEISQQLGISFPVYVLFTRMNRAAFFEDFVRNLTAEETGQAVGATLPLAARPAGIYAEEQTGLLTAAFEGLFHSLADHRVVLLPRENDPTRLSSAYEFPREFRKLRNLLIQFLVDVCRPSQLRASPFLRGFYFSGVRPVVVEDAPAVAPRPSAARASGFEASATGVFRFDAPAAETPLSQVAPGRRKQPQWLFLSQLFAGVIERDEAALGTSGSSTKTSLARRILFVSAAALCLIFAAGATVSFFGNRALVNEVLTAARGIPADEAGGMDLPRIESLQQLDSLRLALVKLKAYEQDGPPWRLRWFLFRGPDLLPQARRVYYARFQQLLFAQTQAGLLSSLGGLPAAPAPADDYGATYDTLKAYLVTTSEWKRSTSWLAPVLVARWAARRPVESLLPLARKQFEFYAEDLPRGNPFTEKNEPAAIDRARLYLSKFSGLEQIYQFMLSDASRRAKKVNFNEQFPGSAEVVLNNRDVPGAFTRPGWAAMQDNLAKVDKFFGGERWVLGDYSAAKPDTAKLQEELRARYAADYIARWREFLRTTAVARYSGMKDAARKLNILSGAQTPLMALFWVATQNTAVDSPKVAEAFDAVHKVVPPPATAVQYVWPTNQEYMGALASLQTAIGQVADLPGPPDPTRAMPARQSADAARNIVKKMGYTFKIDPEAHLETTVLKLLEAPIEWSDAVTKGIGSGEVNAKARQFCLAFAAVAAKFPFNPTATAEASLPEVNRIFRPREGLLWAFHAENLQALLQKQGAQYVLNPAGGVQLTPAFIGFFNAAARFSEALYPGGAAEPALRYTLAAQPSDQIKEMNVTIDGQSAGMSPQAAPRQYTWPGGAVRNVRISAKLAGGSDFEFQNRDGLWSLFRFFADADRWTPAGNAYVLEWIVRQGREGRPVSVGGKELTYRFAVDTGGMAPVFQKDFLNGLRCVSQAAR